MSITVRPAGMSDIPELSRVLGIAFADDPIISWLIPDDAARPQRAASLFAAQTRHHFLSAGGVEVACDESGRIGGATLWAPPGHWHASNLTTLRQLPGLVRAFRSRLGVAAKLADIMMSNHPTEPHWYLAVIGTLPEVRGKGYGQALLNSRLDRCDAAGIPAYLESSKPENVPYYERFGFTVTGTLDATAGGPPLWPMWRTPEDAHQG
ncbi:GNAT family N-acetyltransferase [Nocardia sp. NBC_00511]|uniref:GNAT family N-acetyltransferase n=1 Tax=Nocardia sp. NBC_00511 TaxID=2903591 RepID=UPI0030E20066